MGTKGEGGVLMLTDSLLTDGLRLRVDGFEMEEETVVISVTSMNQKGICPHCQTISERIHSSYQRRPADVPFAGCVVRLDMTIPRFFCDNEDCEPKTFTERIPDFIEPYAHRTNRLASQQRQAAFALGGEAGSRLLATLGMTVSPDTLLRLIRKAPEPEVTAPRVLGVDDWAKRKGHSYGTILVDLEAQQAVDLLPDRTAESFAKWLKEHLGVEIISRDRGTEYIRGANEGAPDAIQVADRWHLLSNLREALKRLLESKHGCLRAAADRSRQDGSKQEKLSPNHDERLEKSIESTTPPKLTKAEKRRLERRAKRQERYEAVKELHRLGVSKSEIARRLNLDWRTVDKYIKADECPVYARSHKRPSILDPYMDYMRQRWESGCHNATQIWREIRKLGFGGARRTVAEWATKRRKSTGSDPASEKIVPWSASRAAWLLIKQEEELTDDDKQALERMKQADEKVAEAYSLGQRFVEIVRERRPEALSPWLGDAAKSRIGALMGFARSIKQDLTAVTNALSLPWSNGQVEGQVNRLKLIKRQMYGRANFDLLRKRVIVTPLRC